MIPAALSFLLAWHRGQGARDASRRSPRSSRCFAAFATLDRPRAAPVRSRLPVLARALFRGLPDPSALDVGLSPVLSPLALVAFNVGFLALAYPAGALSDRMSPRSILMAGMGVLIAADLLLAQDIGLAGLILGILLWGAHMALTQGIFARMIADVAPDHLRATSFGAFYFVSGIGTLLASLARGATSGTATAPRRRSSRGPAPPPSPWRCSAFYRSTVGLRDGSRLALSALTDSHGLAMGRERRHARRASPLVDELVLQRRSDVKQDQARRACRPPDLVHVHPPNRRFPCSPPGSPEPGSRRPADVVGPFA